MSITLIILFAAYIIGSISLKGIILWVSPAKTFPNQLDKTFSLKTHKLILINAIFDFFNGLIGAYIIYSMSDSELLVSIWGIGLVIGNTWPIFSKFTEKLNLMGFLGVLSYINILFTIIYVLLGIAIFIFLNHPELSFVISSTILPFLILAFSWIGINQTYLMLGLFFAVFIPIKLRNQFPSILESKGNDLVERFKKRNLSTKY